MNYAAIRHEATQDYCFCLEPGRFLFRLQAGKGDLRKVTLHTRDKYLPLKLKDTRRQTPMGWVSSDGFRDYYEAELEFKVVCLRYCFELEDHSGNRIFFSNTGFTDSIPDDMERLFDCPQTLREEERFIVPQWAANRVVYQIFPSRFATHKSVKDSFWYQAPIGPKTDLGGSIRGIIAHLDHIRDLGADVIYLNPIFRSNSTHKYDTIDYYTIDPSFGTEEDLTELVEKAHAMGLRVILDGVFNHTSPEFFAFRDLVKNQAHSSYKDWYYVDSFPLCRIPGLHNYKCFGYFWITFAVCLTAHCQVHTYFCALAHKVCVKVFNHFWVCVFGNTYYVFCNKRQFCIFYQFVEFVGRNTALWAFFWSSITFVNISAYRAYKFLHCNYCILWFKMCFCFTFLLQRYKCNV